MTEDRSYVPVIEQLEVCSPTVFESVAGKEWATGLISRLEKHSRWTFEHSVRVADIVACITHVLGISQEKRLLLVQSGLLHDAGKLLVPLSILDSVELQEDGRESLDQHPRIGFYILNEFDGEAARIIVAHHEFQTRTYPRNNGRNSSDSELLFYQSLIALADATDALLSERPYKPVWSLEDTRRYLKDRFDSSLIETAIDSRLRI